VLSGARGGEAPHQGRHQGMAHGSVISYPDGAWQRQRLAAACPFIFC